jgi:ribose/xylose/arabinose/galactoside ABC-type transport system permease subunit
MQLASMKVTRYVGLPARRRQALVYLLSGIISSLAAIIYVAPIGLAKSDLGTVMSYKLSLQVP